MSDNARDRDAIEVVSGILLALATTASAWCAYQAALWNGEQTRTLATANAAHLEALRKSNTANMEIIIDVTTFLDYVHDVATGDLKTAGYLRRHARPEFRPTFDRWIAETDSGRKDGPLPFASPDYRLRAVKETEALHARATQLTNRSNDANETSDRFVLHTVLFALALFFLGSSTQTPRRMVRRATLGFGALVLILGLISMLRIPRAPPPFRAPAPPTAER